MEDIAELKEKAGRYKRLSESEDFIKTIEEVDEHFCLLQNVFGALKAGQGTDWIVAKEGARAYSNKLKMLSDEFKLAVEQAEEEQTQGDKEYE